MTSILLGIALRRSRRERRHGEHAGVATGGRRALRPPEPRLPQAGDDARRPPHDAVRHRLEGDRLRLHAGQRQRRREDAGHEQLDQVHGRPADGPPARHDLQLQHRRRARRLGRRHASDPQDGRGLCGATALQAARDPEVQVADRPGRRQRRRLRPPAAAARPREARVPLPPPRNLGRPLDRPGRRGSSSRRPTRSPTRSTSTDTSGGSTGPTVTRSWPASTDSWPPSSPARISSS